jgi:hypothetical protein
MLTPKVAGLSPVEPRTDCVRPRIIRLEGNSTSIPPEFYPVRAPVKHLATNPDVYAICRPAQKSVFVQLDRGTTMACAGQD